MESLLENLKEGFILTVEAKTKGNYSTFDEATAASTHFMDTTHKPDAHIIDYTVKPHVTWHYDYARDEWEKKAT